MTGPNQFGLLIIAACERIAAEMNAARNGANAAMETSVAQSTRSERPDASFGSRVIAACERQAAQMSLGAARPT